MKIYDISVDVAEGMHVFPGDPKFHCHSVKSLGTGDSYELHRITLGNHAGTHVDAPSHLLQEGAKVNDLSLEVMNGRVRVVEIHNPEKIDVPELLQLVLVDDFRLLFKTRNSHLWGTEKHFSKKYIYLTEDGAGYLTENGIKLVGIDYLSVDRYGDESYPAHKILLGNQIVIVEGLNLVEVEEGEYDMSCLPLRLPGLDAAPARVILRR